MWESGASRMASGGSGESGRSAKSGTCFSRTTRSLLGISSTGISVIIAIPVAFAVAGLCLGLAYSALVAGLDRGRVSVVAPLNATQSLWAVVFAALFLGQSEAIGRRVTLAAVLVVAGGALIGIFR